METKKERNVSWYVSKVKAGREMIRVDAWESER